MIQVSDRETSARLQPAAKKRPVEPVPKPESAGADAAEGGIKIDLISAQRSHAIIEVQPEGAHAVYQSTIVGVDLNARCIVIDELFPGGFVGWRGQPLTLTLRLAGNRRVSFATRLLDMRADAAAPRYHLALPAGFSYTQRRQTYRFRLGAQVGGYAEFRLPGRYLCSGQLQDISLCGLRVTLQQQVALSAGDILAPLDFEFAGLHCQCQGLVRNCEIDAGGNTVAGIEFLNLPRPQERQLERVMFRLHRQAARAAAQSRVLWDERAAGAGAATATGD